MRHIFVSTPNKMDGSVYPVCVKQTTIAFADFVLGRALNSRIDY